MSSLERIDLFNALFYVALVAAIVFLVAAVIMFFVFKIPQVYMLRTGKSRKKSVEEMRKVNSETGRLASHSAGEHGISAIFGSSTELNIPPEEATTEVLPNSTELAQRAAAEEQGRQETTVLPQQSAAKQEPAGASGETTVLGELAPQEPEPEPEEEKELEPDTSFGEFEIVRYIIKIHTDEMIG